MVRKLALCLVLAALAGCANNATEQSPGATGERTADAHAGHKEASQMGGDAHNMESGAHAGHAASGKGATLMVTTEPAQPQAGKPTTLRLMLHDAAGKMLKDFETIHEQKTHLIIVRDTLDEFAHIHPAPGADGNMTAPFTFPTGGKYRLYADYKVAGQPQSNAVAEVEVAGAAPTAPALVRDAPGKVQADGLQADIQIENAKPDQEAAITFKLTDAAGKPVADLQPYMGAMGHLVILSADGKDYVHSHPVEGQDKTGTVAFEAHFARPGLFKGWGQFLRQGKVRVVPFVMEVQ